jgi:hypothetical protein
MGIDDLLNKLEAEEQDFLKSEVLAPVLPGQAVTVRIAGIVCQLRVDDQRFEGWAVLQPLSLKAARIIRPARLAEAAAYLELFPKVGLIALAREGRRWLALPAHKGDSRFQIEQPVPVLLTEESIQPFDTVSARFDGRLFWYERRDPRRNPALAAYLRQSLNEQLEPKDLHKPGLSAEERATYASAWSLLEEARRSKVEVQLAEALAHAGGRMESFIERDETYTISYHVDGARHVSTVRKNDLSVLTAGICLSGQDQRFDLTSLVGVMREAQQRGRVVRVGNGGMREEDYRRAHPPEEQHGRRHR